MQISDLYKLYLEHPVVTTDSRDCPEGSIFFALKGESFNGNKFAQSALDKGCALAVVDEVIEGVVDPSDPRFVLVDNVEQSLQELAAYHRSQMQLPVIQITGTNGKTTTKELLSAVLAEAHNVLYTQGNLNNHLGVPRTLLRITPSHDIAVIETGANHPGEIDFLCRMVKADCGLVTNVGRAHLEGFGSFEGVKRTKGELYDDLKERGGYVFLNMMDEDLVGMAMERELNAVPYVQGVVLSCNPFLTIRWMDPQGQPHDVQTHLIGSYNLPNLLAAATVGLRFGVSPEQVDHALANYIPSNNRSEFRDTGRNHLIVDAYNANPTSMAAALDNFSLVEADHKMAILGDMRELGAESEMEHQKVVDKVGASGIETVWFVGDNFRKAVHHYRTFSIVEEVKAAIQAEPIEGRTILIKGSNGTKLFQLPELL